MFVQKQKLVVTFGEELWQKLPPIGSTNCDGNDPQLGVAFIYRCRPKRQKVNMSGNYCNYSDTSDMDHDDAESIFLISDQSGDNKNDFDDSATKNDCSCRY